MSELKYTATQMNNVLSSSQEYYRNWKEAEKINKELRARISELSQAVGLITTLKPTMVMDADHPLDMAKEVEAYVTARIAELEALVDELKPYRDGYDPEEVFPPEDEWVWLRDCDDNIEPVQYSHKTEWYWNYEGCWMPDNGDIRRWYPIGKLPEVTE